MPSGTWLSKANVLCLRDRFESFPVLLRLPNLALRCALHFSFDCGISMCLRTAHTYCIRCGTSRVAAACTYLASLEWRRVYTCDRPLLKVGPAQCERRTGLQVSGPA